jgi:hypothetical protein
MHRFALLFLALASAAPAAAQQSASFQLREHAFNAGGRPDQGAIAQSTSFRVTLDAIGDAVGRTGLSSASFSMDAGFVVPYPPPEEVTGVLFVDRETLVWDPEKSTGTYGLYRSLVSTLPGLGYGLCQQADLPGETTDDGDVPPVGESYFYLVTAENLLAEEGTKGFNSAGGERANLSPCP